MAQKKGPAFDSRAALLEAAVAVAAEAGFDRLTVDAVTVRARLSKGTFFHFFASKEALLEAMCVSLTAQAWAQLHPLLAPPGAPVERLARYLAGARGFRLERAGAVMALGAALAREENDGLRRRLAAARRDLVRAPLAALIAEGNETGDFAVADAEVTADLLLEWADAAGEGTLRLLRGGGSPAMAARRVNAALEAAERMLGARTGALGRLAQGALSAMAAPEGSTS
jgi:AcrR family transcriptional regulator